MNEEITTAYAVQALQVQCVNSAISVDEARETLAAFVGIPHKGKSGAEMFLFVGQVWDVEVVTFPESDRCILWRTMTPE